MMLGMEEMSNTIIRGLVSEQLNHISGNDIASIKGTFNRQFMVDNEMDYTSLITRNDTL